MSIDNDWMQQTNVYEVNVRQYTPEGTFNAFVLHLPRLKNMGVQTLWFMPVTPIAQKHKKGTVGSPYACSDYVSINPEFGTLEDFKNLVAKAQGIGFKIIIDWVVNHTGWDHVWTVEHPDWYKKDEATGDFKRASGMDDIIELDFGNHAMRSAMIDAMRFWIVECGIDGFRCDLAFWVQLDFWVDAKNELEKTKKLFWLAEADSIDHPAYMQVFNASYTWAWMHKTEAFCKQQFSFYDLLQLLQQYLHTPGMKAWFTSNHDENSWNGTEYEKYGYLAKALAVFSCTWPGIPLIYAGQELPNNKRLAFFDKDEIEWSEDVLLHQFYKTLLTMHATHPALNAMVPVDRIETTADDKVLAYQRTKDSQTMVVAINFFNDEVTFDITGSRMEANFQDVFSGKSILLNQTPIKLEPGGFIALQQLIKVQLME